MHDKTPHSCHTSHAADSAAQRAELAAAADALGAALRAKGQRLVSAESCTGGMVAVALTDIAGSSAWFERGFVTYSNDAKHELLGVPEALLATHGAVSEPVALAMAHGALQHAHAEISLSITGIAGPGGEVPGKPVGTVCFGWTDGLRLHCETRHFAGTRDAVRHQAAIHALRGALSLLQGEAPAHCAGHEHAHHHHSH